VLKMIFIPYKILNTCLPNSGPWQDRKVVGEWKYIENNFDVEGSSNDNLDSVF